VRVRSIRLVSLEVAFPGLAHAVLVQSTIAAGRISGIDAAAAEAAPGVLAVITYENAPAG
jgi:CO/xanthine dehydrogenase Mo-binding subunit